MIHFSSSLQFCWMNEPKPPSQNDIRIPQFATFRQLPLRTAQIDMHEWTRHLKQLNRQMDDALLRPTGDHSDEAPPSMSAITELFDVDARVFDTDGGILSEEGLWRTVVEEREDICREMSMEAFNKPASRHRTAKNSPKTSLPFLNATVKEMVQQAKVDERATDVGLKYRKRAEKVCRIKVYLNDPGLECLKRKYIAGRTDRRRVESGVLPRRDYLNNGHSSDRRPQVATVAEDDDSSRLNDGELLLRVEVLTSTRPVFKMAELIIPASMTLEDLHHCIPCPLEHGTEPYTPYFFIENALYYATATPDGKSYELDDTHELVDWSKGRSQESAIAPYSRETMASTRLDSLNMRLNYPYVYAHLQTCHHTLLLTSIRSFTSGRDNPVRTHYPIRIFTPRVQRSKCQFCEMPCEKMTWFDECAGQFPGVMCSECFELLHPEQDRHLNLAVYDFPDFRQF